MRRGEGLVDGGEDLVRGIVLAFTGEAEGEVAPDEDGGGVIAAQDAHEDVDEIAGFVLRFLVLAHDAKRAGESHLEVERVRLLCTEDAPGFRDQGTVLGFCVLELSGARQHGGLGDAVFELWGVALGRRRCLTEGGKAQRSRDERGKQGGPEIHGQKNRRRLGMGK